MELDKENKNRPPPKITELLKTERIKQFRQYLVEGKVHFIEFLDRVLHNGPLNRNIAKYYNANVCADMNAVSGAKQLIVWKFWEYATLRISKRLLLFFLKSQIACKLMKLTRYDSYSS
jgi:hypothetical protein